MSSNTVNIAQLAEDLFGIAKALDSILKKKNSGSIHEDRRGRKKPITTKSQNSTNTSLALSMYSLMKM